MLCVWCVLCACDVFVLFVCVYVCMLCVGSVCISVYMLWGVYLCQCVCAG